jgi:hypothetical protein
MSAVQQKAGLQNTRSRSAERKKTLEDGPAESQKTCQQRAKSRICRAPETRRHIGLQDVKRQVIRAQGRQSCRERQETGLESKKTCSCRERQETGLESKKTCLHSARRQVCRENMPAQFNVTTPERKTTVQGGGAPVLVRIWIIVFCILSSYPQAFVCCECIRCHVPLVPRTVYLVSRISYLILLASHH